MEEKEIKREIKRENEEEVVENNTLVPALIGIATLLIMALIIVTFYFSLIK